MEVASSGGEDCYAGYNNVLKVKGTNTVIATVDQSSQTALGSARMILETGVTPEQLIVNVTTPGGTTAEGNKVLNESNISEILFETVQKTAQKSELMGKQLG